MRVVIVGQGYVGLTIATGAISAGHQVIGIDKNIKLVESLNAGISHIEGICSDLIANAIKSKKYEATSDFSSVSDSEIVIFAVPTPLDQSKQPDLSLLVGAIEMIAPYLRNDVLVINESTSYIGTLRRLIAESIGKINPKVTDFAVSPERVDPGNELFGVKNTPRLVGGLTVSATNRAYDFYSSFCDYVVKVSTPEIAEAAKLLENSFRFVNISFINEFTQIINSLGISPSEVIDAASTKPYGFMSFTPNVGVGGHCIPVDPIYLQKNARDIDLPSRFIDLSQALNLEMPDFSVERLEAHYGSIRGKHILVVGVSYKPNIADVRESPADAVIHNLERRGSRVSWHDPLVEKFNGGFSSPVEGDYDLALILVNHRDLNMEGWSGNPIYCVNFTPSRPDWIPIFSPVTHRQ